MNSEQPAKIQLSTETRQTLRLHPWIMIAVLLVAAFFRFYQLPSIPPGLNFDEAGNGVAALDILNGAPKIWWQIGGGKEPLWPYIIALGTAILGASPLSLRLPAAMTGILTIAAVYPLVKSLFRASRQRYLIALLTMLGLALSGWHLHFSRLGFRAILLPLLSTLAFYFLWQSLNHHKVSSRTPFYIPNIVLSAFFLALSIYAYLAARIVPLVIILFWLLSRLIQFFAKKRHFATGNPVASPSGPPFPATYSLLRLFVFLLIFLSPLIFHFILYPVDFLARTGAVSIFNPDWQNGDLAGTAWRILTLTLRTFFGIAGDANPLVNLPKQPALSPLFALFFLLGLGIGLTEIFRGMLLPPRLLKFQHAQPYSPYLFLLCWWSVMLLPAVLAPEGAPHHLRLIGTIVPVYIFIAVGVAAVTNFFAKLLSRSTRFAPHALRLACVLPVACYLFLAVQTYTAYFIRWPKSVDFTLPFDIYATRLAADIAQSPLDTAYVLPMDIRAAEEARHYTLDYLLSPLYPAPYRYIPVDERNAETGLTQAAAGKHALRVVRWAEDKHHEADAKEIVTFLLQSQAVQIDYQSFPVYSVESFSLPNGDAFTFKLPSINHPIGANFDGLLRLDAAFVPPTASPGKLLPVALTLAPIGSLNVDYKISLRLTRETGERVAQKDRVLLHNFHQGTSLWPQETVNEYYLLPLPPKTVPGAYNVTAVIYHPDTLAPLVADGLVEVLLGTVTVANAR